MTREKTIDAPELMASYREMLEEIHRDGVVYVVRTKGRDTSHVPSGLVDGFGEVAFVLGPPAVCNRVFGLVDEEYGWPVKVEIEDIQSIGDLAPGPRRHPVLYRDAVCLAVSVMIREYEMIKNLLAGESPPGGSSQRRP